MKKLNLFTTSIFIITLLTTTFLSCSNPTVVNGTSTPIYNVGDLILSDGTVVRYAETPEFTNEQKEKAVAVIFRTGKKPLGLGLNQVSYIEWSKSDGNIHSCFEKAF